MHKINIDTLIHYFWFVARLVFAIVVLMHMRFAVCNEFIRKN